MSDPRDHSVRTQFRQRICDLLDTRPDADILEIAANVDIGYKPSEDRRKDPDYPIEALLRALFAKEVAGWSFPELSRRLEGDPQMTAALGFGDVPDQSTFWNIWNGEYLADELRDSLRRKANWTRNRARAENHPIGDSALKPTDTSGTSQRTENRVIREKLDTVPREMVRLVADEWAFLPSRGSNTQYHRNAFIELESVMAALCLAAEQGAEVYGDNTTRNSGSPDGDTLLHYIKQSTRADILRRFHGSTGLMVNRAKQYLEFDRPVDVAVDITDVAYYGRDRESKWVWDRRGFDKKDHDWAHRYASISIVGDNLRFVLGVIPVAEGMMYGEIVEKLLDEAQLHVSIGTLYADRAFATTDVIRVLNRRSLNYVIPVRRNARITRRISRMKQDVEVVDEYGVYGEQRGRGTQKRAETTLVLLPSQQSSSDAAAFYTDLDVDDSTSLDRAKTKRAINRYRRRWAAETQYRSLKTFLPWTTSNNGLVRLFHFLFGMLVYNLWRIVDFLIQQDMERELRWKPRVKAIRFVNAIRGSRLLG